MVLCMFCGFGKRDEWPGEAEKADHELHGEDGSGCRTEAGLFAGARGP